MACHIKSHSPMMLVLAWLACLAQIGLAASIATTQNDEDLNREVTYTIQNSEEDKIKLVSSIVNALENLGVLDSSHQNCYSLDKITKSSREVGEKSWKVGIFLHVHEMINGKGRPDGGQLGTNDPSASVSASDNAHTVGDKESEEEECLLRAFHEVKTDQNVRTEAPPAGSPADTEGINGTGRGEDGSLANLTAKAIGSDQDDNDKDNGGLSKTQIMVISTCSTVIGVFFIVALIMRIRNYVKRVREEQATRRLNYRSSSVAMRGSFDGRRDSNSNSKVGSSMAKPTGPTSQLINPDVSPSHSSPLSSRKNRSEIQPLLVVTEASVPSSPASERLPAFNGLPACRKNSSSGESFLGEDADPAIFFDSNHRTHLHPAIIYNSNLYSAKANNRRHSDSNSNRNGKAAKCDNGEAGLSGKKRKVASDSNLQTRDTGVSCDPGYQLPKTDLDRPNNVHKRTKCEELVPDALVSAGLTQSDSSISASPTYSYVWDGHQREYRPPDVIGQVTELTYPQYSNHKTSESDSLIDVDDNICSSDVKVAKFIISSDESAENSPSWSDRTDNKGFLAVNMENATNFSQIIPEYDVNLNSDGIKIENSKGLPKTAMNHYNDIFGSLIVNDEPRRPSLKLPSTAIPNEARQRKSVSFSVEEDEISVDELSTDSGEVMDDPFLLGSEFEGMKPTYV